ncbi:branched-chain amino acid transport system II carrier protein [Peptostreptococcus russellii]|uniref:branched-chain amino acid transport system II carrier protein n=1 Tax=Peptostreptococcus russellii TaxID=215200 RepID=UPI000D0F4C8A|nr:branched-chain amino acid transport system II carrier protein [Peptostreptococcus russellii]
MDHKTIRVKDVFVVGFALFAMFFGAGNLIFPPYLGVVSGSKWWIAFLGFLFADAGLSLLVIISLTKFNGEMDALFNRVGKGFAAVMGSVIVICIGPLIAVPRTAATTYEVGILPTIGPGFNRIIFSIIFFAIVLALTIKPSKVVDIVGQFLTPVLLISLAILIIKGAVSPLGQMSDKVLIEGGLFSRGIKEGYQTLDSLGAFVFASIIIASLVDKGYKEEKIKIKATIMAGVVAAVGMLLVYGGLAYLGATVSSNYGADIDSTALLVAITYRLMGNTGKILLAIMIALACLTTAIGVTSSCGLFFSRLSKNKISYEKVVLTVCILSAIVSNFGVTQILSFALPILLVVYPGALTLVVLGLFNEKIKDDIVFRIAAATSLIFSFIVVVSGLLGNETIPNLVAKLPLANLGFEWVVPVVISIVIGFMLSKKDSKSSSDIEEPVKAVEID